ncbi:amidohydrolase 2 [Cylindrobasidium torrendii FP15055 ss-10]|uniref:6-methylsalicylate decarboxylase n=1 Tax=Cylindrobasidium torrendii FP15055 ss-10 TaxID=1314674 RepID=A0A0D7BUE7_9AGAR|nr:amidohydrolase 2 [Cylindrobasidium torrendii FP15055 ss-10]
MLAIGVVSFFLLTHARRIDIHNHFFSPALAREGDVGWKLPSEYFPWTPDFTLGFLQDASIDVAVLSIPAYPEGEISQDNRDLSRQLNLNMSIVCAENPEKFGWFATVPFLDDVKGVLEEIEYALDVLGADGIALSSTYGVGDAGKYLGDDLYEPIWAALHMREAVVFVHGAQTRSSTPWPDRSLGLPVTETYKAAAHLVVTGRKRKYNRAKIILSHMGGSTLMLASRVAVLSPYMGCNLTSEEILEDFQSFYFDTALSSQEATLALADAFVPQGHLLFGTDFPAVTSEMTEWYSTRLEDYYASRDPSKLDAVLYTNACTLFPRLCPDHY